VGPRGQERAIGPEAILLDFAKHKERVGAAVANDRLYLELQRVVLDATLALVETGALTLTPQKPASS